MKVYISIDKPHLNGYVNIDPCIANNKISFDPRNLDELLDNAEATHIIVDDVLDYLSHTQLFNSIQNWVGKLRHGGSIIITGNELKELCRKNFLGEIDTGTFNKILFGTHDKAWKFKSSCLTIDEVTNLLLNFGMKIKRREINGYRYIVEGIRE